MSNATAYAEIMLCAREDAKAHDWHRAQIATSIGGQYWRDMTPKQRTRGQRLFRRLCEKKGGEA